MAPPARILARLLASRSNRDLRRGGREIGYALVRRDAAVVDLLRGAIDGAESEPDPRGGERDELEQIAFARGYRAALADAVASFGAALDTRVEVERAVETLGRREQQVLRALCGEARPQVRVARELAMAPHDVSRAAKRLRAAGLVQAYPGERDTEQLHRVTALGRAVARELDARDVARAIASDDLADGTPPVADTPLYAEDRAWSPAASGPARASSPRVHEIEYGATVDEDE
jgi:DNA-binding MarR family transcriptional regulator